MVALSTEAFTALADRRRRRIVDVLQRLTSATITELATHLVAAEGDGTLPDVTPAEAEQASIALQQVHLPILEDANVVKRSDGVVTIVQNSLLEDSTIEAILDVETEDWDQVLSALADETRRIVLSILHTEGTMDRIDLATEVTKWVRSGRDENALVEPTLIDLHHHHLPKLADAGLVTYDPDTRTVTYEGHPELEAEWLPAGPDETPRPMPQTGEGPPAVRALEEQEALTERERALCESADEELVMLFTDDLACEPACLEWIRDATDRGVDVYVGSQNRQFGDRLREQAPEVTVWKPHLDWLTQLSLQGDVGSLVLADREEILIGRITEGPGGVVRETAIAGTGTDTPLVLMILELLGSRLDHLDAQNADFHPEIPQ